MLFNNDKKSYRLLNYALDNSSNIQICVTDSAGNFIYLNSKAAERVGCSIGELHCHNAETLEKHGLVTNYSLAKVLNTQKPQCGVNYFTKTGIKTLVYCEPVFDDSGTFIATNSFIIPIETSLELIQVLGKDSLKSDIRKIFQEIGMPAHLNGYHYLIEAIIMAVEDTDVVTSITKVLYPQLSQKFRISPCAVERSIRNAIIATWHKGDKAVFNKYLGKDLYDIPTNSVFIATIAELLKLDRCFGKTIENS